MSLIEVLTAVAIVAVVMIPLLGSGSAVHRRSYFTEYHVIALARARSLLHLIAAIDFDVLHQLSASSGSGPLAVDPYALYPDAQATLLPFGFLPASVASYRSKSRLFTEQVQYWRKTDDLGLVDVTIRWNDPADRARTQLHSVHLTQLVHRPERSSAR